MWARGGNGSGTVPCQIFWPVPCKKKNCRCHAGRIPARQGTTAAKYDTTQHFCLIADVAGRKKKGWEREDTREEERTGKGRRKQPAAAVALRRQKE